MTTNTLRRMAPPANSDQGERAVVRQGAAGSTQAGSKGSASASRRSQADRTAATRKRILDATLECLLERGYAGTSTLAVQARAGVSRGALTHHFASRYELLIAAVQHLAHARLDSLRRDATSLRRGADRLSRAIDLTWDTFCEPLWSAALELWVASRTDAELRHALIPVERDLWRELRTTYADVFGTEIAAHSDFDDLFDMTVELMRGIAVTNLLRRGPARGQQLVERWKRMLAASLDLPR